MSRYLIERLSPEMPTPPDELHVRFTLELPSLDECHHAIDFALDYIQQGPAPPPSAITSLLNLIRNFLPPPKPQ